MRITGALALLYAHPVTATVQLTTDDVRIDTDPAVRLGNDFIPLLDPLAHLIAAQLHAVRQPRGQGHPPSHWLFPGGKPGHHLAAGRLHDSLHAASIDIRASKNTAIAAMVTELPGPVVANALNLHPNTIERWARSLAAPWQTYACRPTR